ncbi:hypothetical protein F383_27416 [Gossypium arboreum]|uniref:Uncharacterized protein n=1 Tax=Gossypium arboreum TaxID=29729 RepID=A0A0B0MRN4_GOSAR|nr:hypothetical protein F383_27416 [Gossypium arboreum]
MQALQMTYTVHTLNLSDQQQVARILSSGILSSNLSEQLPDHDLSLPHGIQSQ